MCHFIVLRFVHILLGIAEWFIKFFHTLWFAWTGWPVSDSLKLVLWFRPVFRLWWCSWGLLIFLIRLLIFTFFQLVCRKIGRNEFGWEVELRFFCCLVSIIHWFQLLFELNYRVYAIEVCRIQYYQSPIYVPKKAYLVHYILLVCWLF